MTNTTAGCAPRHPQDASGCEGRGDAIMVQEGRALTLGCVRHSAVAVASVANLRVMGGGPGERVGDPDLVQEIAERIADRHRRTHGTPVWQAASMADYLAANGGSDAAAALYELVRPIAGAAVEARAHSGKATQLAEDLEAIQERVRALAEAIRSEAATVMAPQLHHVDVRIDAAVVALLHVGLDLKALARRGLHTCPGERGVCPKHGDTLIEHPGGAVCREAGCETARQYRAHLFPCTNAATVEIKTAGDDDWTAVCPGHVLVARTALDNLSERPVVPGGTA